MSMQDIFEPIALLPGMAVTLLVGWTIANSLSGSGLFDNTMFMDKAKEVMLIYDASLIFLFLGLIGTAAMLASQIPSHPIYIVPAMLIMVVAVVVSGPIANITYILAARGFPTAANEMSRLVFIIENLPTLIFAGCIIIAFALYTRSPSAPGGEPF